MKKAGLPAPRSIPARALIDTGASISVVDHQIIQQLGLAPTGTASILTPSTGENPHLCNQYDVGIILQHPNLSLNFNAIPVIESRLRHQGIHALIGRDVLKCCLFFYNGDVNRFALAF